jgi:hypothetical protein
MNIIIRPNNAEEFHPEGATVPFYRYTMGEDQIIEFDTSKCGPPEPMVNAMIGLKMINDPQTKLLMINHKKPMGLLDKVGENYSIEEAKMEDGRVQLLFSYKPGESEGAKLDDASCDG